MADQFNGINDASTKEFQRKLFDWFDKRGLLSELRAFMRHRMISALYSSESPCPATHLSVVTDPSPTLQALLLLVAEFLVQQEYHYTMSVMVAEAPLLASFPKFSDYVAYMSKTDSLSSKKGNDFPRYSEKDVQEILEVLGMASNSDSMEHVLRLYTNNNARESLLACVVTALSAIAQNCSSATPNLNRRNKMAEDSYNATKWIEEIRLVLLRAQLTSQQLQQVEELLRRLQADNAHKVRQEENEKHNKLIHIREQELVAEALMREEKFRVQIQEAEEDIRSKQKHLEKVSVQLRQQHDEVLNRLSRVQNHADEVKKQENELSIREKELEKKQAMFEEEHRTLAELRAELQEAAQSLRKEHSDTKTISELSRLQERCLHLELELKDAKNQIMASFVNRAEMGVQVSEIVGGEQSAFHREPISDENTNMQDEHHSLSGSSSCSGGRKLKEEKRSKSQISLLKRVLHRVQQENSELRAIAAQQRKRIDELTLKAAHLANHIAEQAEAASPASQGSAPQHVQQPSSVPLHGTQMYERSEHIQNLQHETSASGFSPQTQGRDWRRRPPRRALVQTNLTTSLSSDESPTEEILREARDRLRKLEEESEAMDRSYRDFRAREVSSASMLFVPAEASAANTSLGLPYQESHKFHHPMRSPSLQSSTHLTSPARAHYGSGTHASPVRTLPRPSSGLASSLSAPLRSQYTFPERPSYSPLSVNRTSQIPDTVSSATYRSSVFKRPSERLKNLFENRPSFMKYSVRDMDDQRNQVMVNTGTSGIGTINTPTEGNEKHVVTQEASRNSLNFGSNHEAKDDSDMCVVADKLQKVSVWSSHNGVAAAHDAKDERDEAREREASFLLDVAPSSGSSAISDVGQIAPELESQNKENVNGSIDVEVKMKDAVPQEKSQSVAGEQIPVPSTNIGPIPAPLPVPVLTSVAQNSVERLATKSTHVDTTLNEISTLSSSPALSNGNTESVKIKEVSLPNTLNEKGEQKNGNYHSSSPFPNDILSKLRPLEPAPEKGSHFMAMENEVVNRPEKESQLLNTSLSSIENSDHQVSAGPEEKKTDDDDDDFW